MTHTAPSVISQLAVLLAEHYPDLQSANILLSLDRRGKDGFVNLQIRPLDIPGRNPGPYDHLTIEELEVELMLARLAKDSAG